MSMDMNPLAGIDGFGLRPDMLNRELLSSGQEGIGPAQAPSNSVLPQDGLAFSPEFAEGPGQAFNHPLLGGAGDRIGSNNGLGFVPGFNGFSPAGAGGQQQQQQMMQMMMLMMLMLKQMMQQNGFGGQQGGIGKSNPGGFGNPVNMGGAATATASAGGASASASASGGRASASASAGRANAAAVANTYNPNPYYSPNPMVNIPNYLGMANNGSLGQNGINLGNNNYNGGGNVYNPTYQFNNLMNGFYQGAEGNCSAVATIKAAMDKYGTGVFQDQQKGQDGGYNITMKDGVGIHLTPQELQMAQQAAQFKGDGGAEQQYAELLYASMAKRAQMEGHEGATDYESALKSLNDGEWPKDTARFLGLQNSMMPVNPGTLNGNNDAVVGWSGTHTVYMDNSSGQLQADHYGQAMGYDGTDTKGHGLDGAFTFV